MEQKIVKMTIEKKVWEVPSLNTLKITQTFGGQKDSKEGENWAYQNAS